MNRFLLQVASVQRGSEGSKQTSAQSVVKEQTSALVGAYLEKEEAMKTRKSSSVDSQVFDRLTNLVIALLTGYDKLTDEQLTVMVWLNPVLSAFIQTGNESVRLAAQKLLKRLQKDQ